jgi:hypothetical protein
MIYADGFDEAIIGVDTEYQRIVYSKAKMIDTLVKGGMDVLDAVDWLEYNTWSAYVGENTPIFVDELTKEEIQEWVDSSEEILPPTYSND